VDTDGGAEDADILLVRSKVAFFTADFEGARTASEAAEPLVLVGARDWKVFDLVAVQGMLAHRSGSWFDRMRFELRRIREDPELANTIFDGHLCPAEYLLYGPMPYAEVIGLARDLRATARRSGALRVVAFASALIGEAALLSGDLGLAAAELAEAGDLHHDLGSAGGEAHSLQRLAEVRVAEGDPLGATGLLEQALPLARASMIARHLLHRIFGTLVAAAADADAARAAVDRAEALLGWDERCPFCSIMLTVPATIACARVGDLGAAERFLQQAERSVELWDGTAWEAAVAEARAAVAAARGDGPTARAQLGVAAERFARAGQPLDAERCRRALAGP
jgi:hypothetical protein